MLALLAVGCTCRNPDESDRTHDDGAEDTGPAVQPTAGTGDTALPTSATSDTAPPGPLEWVMLDMGHAFACGLGTDGVARCWGDPECHSVAPTGEMFVQVEVGLFNACGLRPDGTIRCWCCFDSSDYTCRQPPPPGMFERIVVGHTYACAQDAAGELACWGYGGMLQEGPVPVGPVVDFDIDHGTAAAIMPDHSLHVWGEYVGWELWGGLDQPPASVTWAKIGIGRRHGCGVDIDGNGHCWGDSWTNIPFPDAPPGTFVDVETYNDVSCFLDRDNRATCVWGDPLFDDPKYGMPPPDEAWAQFGLGEWDGCGATTDGRGLCFGHDNWGELQVPELKP